MAKETKVITKRRKFIEVDIPILDTKVELVGENVADIENRTIKLDLTRSLKGKSVEGMFRIQTENNKAVARPFQIHVMSYFIRRMIRKRISYVEDSFRAPTQESMFIIKPFLITRKKVSRAVRKTLRNKSKNWLEDYLSDKTDQEIFSDVLTNKLQKALSLVLKKTYPLSLCEIRVLQIERTLSPEEVSKKKPTVKKEEVSLAKSLEAESLEKVKEAEKEIEKTQKKAVKKEKELDYEIMNKGEDKISDTEQETRPKKIKKTKKKDTEEQT